MLIKSISALYKRDILFVKLDLAGVVYKFKFDLIVIYRSALKLGGLAGSLIDSISALYKRDVLFVKWSGLYSQVRPSAARLPRLV